MWWRDFLRRYSFNEIWIGVNDIITEWNFMNMFSERVNYTNWASYEPNNYCYFKVYRNDIYSYIYYDNCDCVRIRSGEWYDTPCSFTFPALCSQRYNIGKCSECQFEEALMVNKSPHMIYKNKINVIFLVINFFFMAKTYKKLWFSGRK